MGSLHRKRDILRHLSRKGAFYYRRLRDKAIRFDEAGEDVPKGYVPVIVGSEEDGAKFLIHVDMFKNDHFVSLLEMAALEVGYGNPGILRIPCEIQCFTDILNEISRIKT